MKNKENKNFLEFNGKAVSFRNVDGAWWVALKPICDALNVDYIQQFKNTKEDKILSQLLCDHTMVAADGRLRKMICLPEKFIYGWLFSLRSESEELSEFKKECYELLYNYFHGSITDRSDILRTKTLAEIKIDKIKKELMATPLYIELQNLEAAGKKANKDLNKLDRELILNQMELWQS